MKIVFDAVEPEARELFERELTGHELVFLTEKITPQTLQAVSDAEILSIFISSPIQKDYLEALPNLKCIATRSTGTDHIDLAGAKAKNIVVSNVPVYGARTVAEFAFALILALSRKAYAAYDRLRREGTTDVKDYEGFDLAGKTIGIVGTGHIGKNVARIAKGFAMNIIAFDVQPDESFAKETGIVYRPLEDLVAESHIVTLHVPYLPATHHLINAELLAKFRAGGYLINTARGAVVDTLALARVLKNGPLAGAGLDVLEGERELLDETSLLSEEHHDIKEFQALTAAHVLVDMPNVIVTPHIAFNTREAKHEINLTTCENIKAFVSGKPENVIG
ncbi:hydroxyacid dehydrogenase [Candidatus Kaiserbacteria bacterium CG10_big_fil_rev_8_21_14_0_10_51_14]|uniref:Hydroxyacid dehydrogenase n=1 Tax=Candidatus Kaiserbacteria bacterium CG10_big_fil_rev_8_21_14_0_10_51_14 TaxID=1974610 RepID=A0A2H0UCH1_9BACT|nr:MAG: hydroxyacid dehydrogenase [Candidatus Kaiserbacteria bacterium CG10_big_fil_rev_8_21_14_0_10_51_14]